jgi:hypothetical protein
MKNRIATPLLVAVIAGFAVTSSQALTDREVVAITQSIKSAPAAEIAVRAAEVVTKASKNEKEATAVAVVRAGITKSPAAAITIVSSVLKVAPATAPAVAAAAAKLVPNQVEGIAIAAAKAAPDLAEKIVAALTDLNPKYEARVVKAVVMAVPQLRASARTVTAGAVQADIYGGSYSFDKTPLNASDSAFPSDSTAPVAYGATQN